MGGISNAPALPVDIQVFTANGTWTKPNCGANAQVTIEILSGGGGGGRCANGASAIGGGGGLWIFRTLEASLFAATETVVVGAGGAGSTVNAAAGVAGGLSSFGSRADLSAAGGAAGAGSGSSSRWSGDGGNISAGVVVGDGGINQRLGDPGAASVASGTVATSGVGYGVGGGAGHNANAGAGTAGLVRVTTIG